MAYLVHSTSQCLKKGTELDEKNFLKVQQLDVMCDPGLDIGLDKLAAEGISGSTGNLNYGLVLDEVISEAKCGIHLLKKADSRTVCVQLSYCR